MFEYIGHGWGHGNLYLYQGVWFPSGRVERTIEFQQTFQAFDTDLILATLPKSGTTWLKSMTFAIVNRNRHGTSSKHHPLLTTSSHDLVPNFENYDISLGNYSSLSDMITNFLSPILLSTHVPYSSLPEYIKNTNCKIVYICRNPKDNFISLWHYLNKRAPITLDPLPLGEALDLFCNGVSNYGPFWDHVLGYWKESLERPQKILFLKYEAMKTDPKSQLKRLAEYLGYSFSEEEESKGVIEEILSLCSFEHLRNLDVNKYGMTKLNFENKLYFRKAEVGDWKNYLTPAMVPFRREVGWNWISV